MPERCLEGMDCTAHVSLGCEHCLLNTSVLSHQGQSRTKAGKMESWQLAEYGIDKEAVYRERRRNGATA